METLLHGAWGGVGGAIALTRILGSRLYQLDPTSVYGTAPDTRMALRLVYAPPGMEVVPSGTVLHQPR